MAPHLVFGFDFREGLATWRTLREWRERIDTERRAREFKEMYSGPHGVTVYDALGPVFDVAASIEEIESGHFAEEQ